MALEPVREPVGSSVRLSRPRWLWQFSDRFLEQFCVPSSTLRREAPFMSSSGLVACHRRSPYPVRLVVGLSLAIAACNAGAVLANAHACVGHLGVSSSDRDPISAQDADRDRSSTPACHRSELPGFLHGEFSGSVVAGIYWHKSCLVRRMAERWPVALPRGHALLPQGPAHVIGPSSTSADVLLAEYLMLRRLRL